MCAVRQTAFYSVLQCLLWCSVLQFVAVCCSAAIRVLCVRRNMKIETPDTSLVQRFEITIHVLDQFDASTSNGKTVCQKHIRPFGLPFNLHIIINAMPVQSCSTLHFQAIHAHEPLPCTKPFPKPPATASTLVLDPPNTHGGPGREREARGWEYLVMIISVCCHASLIV